MNPALRRFPTADGISLAWTLRPAGHRSVVLVIPGILTHRDCAEHRLLAERLGDLADVASLDVRGHGDSGGAFTFGVQEPDDVAALARALARDYERVAVVGFSFGGFHAVVAAARHPGLFTAVATVGAPAHLAILDHVPSPRGLIASLPLMTRRARRLTRLGLPRQVPPVPWRMVGQVAPTPLLVVHGADDWLVPASHGRRLYEAAGEPRELVVIERGLHAEYMLGDRPERLLDPLRAFLGRYV